jgi:hypothetical protein
VTGAGTAYRNALSFRSTRSFAFASSTVCHCMFLHTAPHSPYPRALMAPWPQAVP